MIRSCVLILSISLFCTAGFIFYKASLENTVMRLFGGPSQNSSGLSTAAAPSLPTADPVPELDEPPLDTDEVFRKVAAMQGRTPLEAQPDPRTNAASSQPAQADAAGELTELTDLAHKRVQYVKQIEILTTSIEPIQMELIALQTRRDALTPQRATAAQQRQRLAEMDAERTTLDDALRNCEQDVAEKEHALSTARAAVTRQKQAREQVAKLAAAQDKLTPKLKTFAKRRAELDATLSTKNKDIAALEQALAVLQNTADASSRMGETLAPPSGTPHAAELDALRKNFDSAKKSAASALEQKRLALEQATRSRDAVQAELAALDASMGNLTAEQAALQLDAEAAKQVMAAAPPTKEQLAALEAALGQSKKQLQAAQDKLAAQADARRTQAESLARTETLLAELEEIESAKAEAETQLSRFQKDRDTYLAQLSSLDERLHTLQERARLALSAADQALTGDAQAQAAHQRPRTLIATLGEGAFAPGNATLQAAANKQISQAIATLRQASGGRVTVEGHTDAIALNGSIKETFGDNINLSYHRAKAVADKLIAGGLNASMVAVTAFGAGQPAFPNETQEGRARNRRVEIWRMDQDSQSTTR